MNRAAGSARTFLAGDRTAARFRAEQFILWPTVLQARDSDLHNHGETMLTTFLGVLICMQVPGDPGLGPPVNGDTGLIELLKDAQSTNVASLSKGAAHMTIDYKYNALKKHAHMEQFITWSASHALLKVRSIDPEGRLGRESMNIKPTNAQTAWDSILITPDKIYWYVSETRTVRIKPRPEKDRNWKRQYFAMLPPEVWFRCCPPNLHSGPTWAEMIAPQAHALKLTRSYEISSDGHAILWSRQDKDGGVVSMEFSLRNCGMLRLFTYKGPAGDRRLTCDWLKSTTGCELRSLNYTKCSASGSIDEEYDLAVLDHKWKLPPNSFSERSFLRNLPANTIVEDSVKGGRYRVNADQGKIEGREHWGDLISLIQSRGFYKN